MAELLFKARCCLRGDKQVAYRDFDPEILYAPVVRHETIRVFIVKSSAQGLIVRGADVDNAYLYGNITNGVKIYMQQPTDSSQKLAMPGHVCQLEKSLSTAYGKRVKFGVKLFTKNLPNGVFNSPIRTQDYISTNQIAHSSTLYSWWMTWRTAQTINIS